MAEAADALHSALQHYHVEAVTKVKDDSTLKSSMRNLAADIDAPSANVSAAERSRLRGRLERIMHDASSAQPRDAMRFKDESTISVFA